MYVDKPNCNLSLEQYIGKDFSFAPLLQAGASSIEMTTFSTKRH